MISDCLLSQERAFASRQILQHNKSPFPPSNNIFPVASNVLHNTYLSPHIMRYSCQIKRHPHTPILSSPNSRTQLQNLPSSMNAYFAPLSTSTTYSSTGNDLRYSYDQHFYNKSTYKAKRMPSAQKLENTARDHISFPPASYTEPKHTAPMIIIMVTNNSSIMISLTC